MSQFLESVREHLRAKRYSLKTEKSYLRWIKAFIRYHDYQHPEKLKESDIDDYLSYLANTKRVSASTQNQALCALVFLYKKILFQSRTILNTIFIKCLKKPLLHLYFHKKVRQ